MRNRNPFRLAAAAGALVLATAIGMPALADDNVIPMNQGLCMGRGRNHDEAYNNAYAQCRTTMNLACVVTSGRLTDVSVDTENDFDYGRAGYQVMLSLSANCVVHNNN